MQPFSSEFIQLKVRSGKLRTISPGLKKLGNIIFFLRVATTGPRSVVVCSITFLVPLGILFAIALHLPWSGTFYYPVVTYFEVGTVVWYINNRIKKKERKIPKPNLESVIFSKGFKIQI